MSNPTDRDKEANPIAEIFDEMFTLLQDLETRSVAVLEYVKEQGGATDEKLAPYLDRAGAAADVRWRAARARMEHLLAPKPKSSTDVAKGDKSASQPKEKGKDAGSATAKSQGEKQSGAKPESKDVGKELASAPSGTDKPAEQKDEKTQPAKPETEAKTKENEKGSDNQSKEPSKSSDAASQAASLARGPKSEPEKGENAKTAQSENGKSSNQQPREDGQQTQKAAK